MFKNVANQKLAVFAWDGTSGVPKTGDASNITAEISLDGGTSAATNDVNPTELDAVDHPGVYIFDLTQAETNADLVVITPSSTTSGVEFRPSIIYPKTAILSEVIEGTYDIQDVLKVLLAFLGGKSSGGGTATITYRDTADTKDRVVITNSDTYGNRSGVTLDVS